MVYSVIDYGGKQLALAVVVSLVNENSLIDFAN